MRELERIDRILGLIRDQWKASPDLRLGQVMYWLVVKSNLTTKADPFYVEDEEWERILKDAD